MMASPVYRHSVCNIFLIWRDIHSNTITYTKWTKGELIAGQIENHKYASTLE